jgi:hypothetical protein
MPKNFYYVESNLPKKSSNKIIEHLTPINTPTYNPATLYNIGDQFQDSNGIIYTTVKSNQKFCLLANTYSTVISTVKYRY